MPTISGVPLLGDDEIARLDAAENPVLAPVRGDGPRRSLPKTYFTKKPSRFTAKFVTGVVLIAVSWVVIAAQPAWPVMARSFQDRSRGVT